ncbi:MAG: hypothetical protein JXR70_14260 [Spirochaetales bacterium]|nr:hypothetical protein [Spirochaetales bacterium]
MFYLLVEVFNWSGIRKIHRTSTEELQNNINEIEKNYQLESYQEEDFIIFRTAKKDDEPRRIANISAEIYQLLVNYQTELYGFNMMLTDQNDADLKLLLPELKIYFHAFEQENKIFVHKSNYPVFQREFNSEPHGDYYTLTIKKRFSFKDITFKQDKWIKREYYRGILDFIELKDSPEKARLLVLQGPKGSGKTHHAELACKEVLGEEFLYYTPRLFIRFKKQSVIHPFLNSLSFEFLNKAEKHLRGVEKKLWQSHAPLLKYLLFEEMEFCIDHLQEDFYLSYIQYLSALAQFLSENLLPLVLICEDFDSYHPEARDMLKKLVHDFSKHPQFYCLIITQEGLSSDWDEIQHKTLDFCPLEINDFSSIIQTIYPKLQLPEKILKKIISASKKSWQNFKHWLYYFEINENIVGEKKEYTWQGQVKDLPSNGYMLRSLIKSLPRLSIELLYIIHLSGGMLPAEKIINFAEKYLDNREAISQALVRIGNYGFVRQYQYFISLATGLLSFLEEHLGPKSETLKNQFIEEIEHLVSRKEIKRYVLLFSFFLHKHKINMGLKLYFFLLKQKLDENDNPGVQPFLLARNISHQREFDSIQKMQLEMIMGYGSIRSEIQTKNYKALEKLINQYEPLLKETEGNLYKAFFQHLLGRAYLYLDQQDRAIHFIKQGKLNFQEYAGENEEALSHTELGLVMLSQGKISSALNYFSLGEDLLNKIEDVYDQVRILLVSALSYFTQGNISKAISNSLQAADISRKKARRKTQAIAYFLLARINFELGEYTEMNNFLILGLQLCTLYKDINYKNNFLAWMGRYYSYTSQYQCALSLLRSLPKDPDSLFFIAEIFLFNNSLHKAYETAKSIVISENTSLTLNLLYWKEGLEDLEAHALHEDSRSRTISRYIESFTAYLGCLIEPSETLIDSLHRHTRNKKMEDQDPLCHIPYFLYYQIINRGNNIKSEDPVTLLNLALKQLQERASKIDMPKDRIRFVLKNHWNKQIIDEAKIKYLL